MKKAIGIIIALVVIVGICFVVVNKQQPKQTSGKPVVKVGLIYPLSGNLAMYGKGGQNAAKLFFEKFNQEDHFFDYQLLWEDSKGESATAILAAKKLIELDKVNAIITVTTKVGNVVRPLTEQHKILHFNIGPDWNVANGSYNFVASDNSEAVAETLYQGLLDQGVQRLSIVAANADGQHSHVKYFRQVADREKKLVLVNTYYANLEERDFRTILAKIQNEKPDAIFITLSLPLSEIFLRQAHTANLDIPLFGINILTLVEDKSLANGILSVNSVNIPEDYLSRYIALSGEDVTYFAEYLDTNLRVLTNAYEQTKSTDPEVVVNYIMQHRDIGYSSLGSTVFTEEGAIYGQPVLTKIQNGKAIVIEK